MGARLYETAADLAKGAPSPRNEILVAIFHARELIRVAPAQKNKLVSEIRELAKKGTYPDIPFWSKSWPEGGKLSTAIH
jgi:hypothetical protein